MTLERRLHDALHSADSFEASPDLFARVTRSVEEDKAHRTRVIWSVFLAVVAVVLFAVFLGLNVVQAESGRFFVAHWVLELSVTVTTFAVILALGPSIRRFGRNYVDDAFIVTEGTGGRVLSLLDLAYYLVFAGLALTTVDLSALSESVALGRGVEEMLYRIGRVLLIMGILHATTLLVIPVVGFVYSSLIWTGYRNALGRGAPAPSPGALQSARIMKIILIVVAVVIALNLLLILPLIFGFALDP